MKVWCYPSNLDNWLSVNKLFVLSKLWDYCWWRELAWKVWWRKSTVHSVSARVLSRSTGYPCKYTFPWWKREGTKTHLEIKLATNFISPTSLFKNHITVMLAGSANRVRILGELKYMTVFGQTICTPWVLLVLEHKSLNNLCPQIKSTETF